MSKNQFLLVILLVVSVGASMIKMELNKIPRANLLQLSEKQKWPTDDSLHQEGWNGTFDNKVVLDNGENAAGAIFIGKLYVSDVFQPLRLIFDTGSDYLAITSDLCKNKKLGQKGEQPVDPAFDAKTPARDAHVQTQSTVQYFLDQVQEQNLAQLSNSDDNDEKTEQALMDASAGETLNTRCDTSAYVINASSEASPMKEDFLNLNYGTAHLKGFLYQDKVCIDPIGNRCASKFEFLALFDAKGLGEDVDGILGLSAHHDESKKGSSFVQSLKNNGVIDKAVVSFSIAPGQSYALFGDWNVSQVAGGAAGLHSCKTFGYLPDFAGAGKNWALEGQSLLYGQTELKGVLEKSFPAIIDTGSNTLGVPNKYFDDLKKSWEKDVGKINCDNGDFCEIVGQSCESLNKKLQPIGIQMSGHVFEVPPSLYMFQADGKCQFAIFKNDVGGDIPIFIIGEPLLQKLYLVYDYENAEIKMGVNVAATDKVMIYPPGQRPHEGGDAVLDEKVNLVF